MTAITYQKKSSGSIKAIRNYYVDIVLLLPFILSLVTGLVLLIYHTGKPFEEETLNIVGDSWLIIHKVLSIVTFSMVVIHLFLHFNWLKKLFALKLKNKHKGINIALFILFLLTVLTSALSWLIVNDIETATLLRGIHNKLGLLLIVFLVIHLKNYFNWLIVMTKRVLNN